MIRRHELSDAEWDLVEPLLSRSGTGRPRLDDRSVLNGIVWKYRTGVAWRDVPQRYGSWGTLHTRFRRWAQDGTFDRMLRAAQANADAVAPGCGSGHTIPERADQVANRLRAAASETALCPSTASSITDRFRMS